MPVQEKRRVLVTGASRGIGLAIARAFVASGHEVLTTSTSGWPEDTGFSPARHFTVSFQDREAVDDFAAVLGEEAIDVLINNAGINKIAPFAEIDPDDFLRIQAVNVYAPFRFCQAVIPFMSSRKWGRIVNVSSVWGMRSKEYRASYSTSKFAIDGMTAALAMEHSQNGILANCVAPGFIDTELTRRILSADQMQQLTSLVASRRLGKVDEVAALVEWLCSDANTFITGQNVPIDGGYTRA